MLVTVPEKELLFAIFKQAISDYLKLDPDGDSVSADFFESEGDDFKTAEAFIFYAQPIYYGKFELTFNDLCELFSERINTTSSELKRRIVDNAIDF